MQRQIKFRAWDKDEQIMFYPDSIHGLNSIHFFSDLGVSVNGIRKSFEEVELMQFTGLLDKNGVEIYEGDIVKDRSHSDLIFPVIWDEKRGGYWMPDEFDKEYQWPLSEIECEVIGNIYENLELINQN